MDLTPPSLTNSPYSPQRKSLDSPPPFAHSSCMPEGSGTSYESLSSLDNSCSLPSPYGSIVDPSLSHPVDIGSPFAPLDSIPPSVAWTTPNIGAAPSPPASTASNMPNVLSDYDSFSNYELSAPYPASGAYSRPTSHSPAFMHTPPPSTSDAPGRDPSSFSSRGSFGITQEQLASKPRLGEPLSYSPVPDGSQYPAPRALAPSSHPNKAHFGSNGPSYLAGDMQPPSQSQSPMPTSLQPHTPDHLQSMAPQLVPSSPMPDASPRTWTGVKRAKRRPTRKHTTKEEANFQCTVKGCGKFFSRSYNFKSHMETHDEKREYPFPCHVPNCTKKFVRKTDLQRHHQSVHTKERNHKCDYCGRLFARKDTLRRSVPYRLGNSCEPRKANWIPGTWRMDAPRDLKWACSKRPPTGTA